MTTAITILAVLSIVLSLAGLTTRTWPLTSAALAFACLAVGIAIGAFA